MSSAKRVYSARKIMVNRLDREYPLELSGHFISYGLSFKNSTFCSPSTVMCCVWNKWWLFLYTIL